MRLRNVFSSKATRFSRAIEENNLEDMKVLMGKKTDFIVFRLFERDLYEKMSTEMMTLLAEGMDKDISKRWRFDIHGGENFAKALMLVGACERGRTDLADIVVAQKNNFNVRKILYSPAEFLLGEESVGKISPEKRVEYLRAVLSGGTDKLDSPDDLLWTAARSGYVDGLKVLASVGFDLNKDNDKALRLAAKAGKHDAGTYLVTEGKADINRAISICEALGGENDTALFLRNLRGDLPEEQTKAPRTVESLSAEVDELRATVRNLSAVIEEMRAPEKALDKKPLSAKASAMPTIRK